MKGTGENPINPGAVAFPRQGVSDSLYLVICDEKLTTGSLPTGSLNADLCGGKIASRENCVSKGEATRRFRRGISKAGSWYRCYRQTGEKEAPKQRQPSRWQLNVHGASFSSFNEAALDITLAEILLNFANKPRRSTSIAISWSVAKQFTYGDPICH